MSVMRRISIAEYKSERTELDHYII